MSLSEQRRLKLELMYNFLLGLKDLKFALEDLYGRSILPFVLVTLNDEMSISSNEYQGEISAKWNSTHTEMPRKVIPQGNYILVISDGEKIYKEVFTIRSTIVLDKQTDFMLHYPFNIS